MLLQLFQQRPCNERFPRARGSANESMDRPIAFNAGFQAQLEVLYLAIPEMYRWRHVVFVEHFLVFDYLPEPVFAFH